MFDHNIDIAVYQKLKDYTGEALIECDSKLFDCFFLPAEKLFREFVSDDLIKKKKLLENLINLFFRERQKFFPDCHDFDVVLAKRFFTIRLHIHGKEITRIIKCEVNLSKDFTTKSVEKSLMTLSI